MSGVCAPTARTNGRTSSGSGPENGNGPAAGEFRRLVALYQDFIVRETVAGSATVTVSLRAQSDCRNYGIASDPCPRSSRGAQDALADEIGDIRPEPDLISALRIEPEAWDWV